MDHPSEEFNVQNKILILMIYKLEKNAIHGWISLRGSASIYNA